MRLKKSSKINEPINKRKNNTATVSKTLHKKESPHYVKNHDNNNNKSNTFTGKLEDSRRHLKFTPPPPMSNTSISNTNPSITSNCSRDGSASTNSDQ